MLDTIKTLCNIDGVSGREDAVRERIISLIKDHCEYSIDPLGSLICFKKGTCSSDKKIMFSAHMDEVGFIVIGITEDGFLNLRPVGGILDSALQSRILRTSEGRKCVFGGKTWHLIRSGDARKEFLAPDALYGDIGASSKEEAEKYVSMGDVLTFDTETSDFGENLICGKALDDRIGCGVMIDLIRSPLPYDAYFAFTVAEEVGTRGAGPVTYSVRPDCAIVLEGTTAADLYGSQGSQRVTVQGQGVAVSFADRSTIYDRELFELTRKTAEENSISYQLKTAVAGGNDAGDIHKATSGVRTVALSVPARYIHTSMSTVDKRDILSMRKLAESLLTEISK